MVPTRPSWPPAVAPRGAGSLLSPLSLHFCTSQTLPGWPAGPRGSRGSSSPAPRPCPELNTPPPHTPSPSFQRGSPRVPGHCSAPQDPRNPQPQCRALQARKPRAGVPPPSELIPGPGHTRHCVPNLSLRFPLVGRCSSSKQKCLQTSGTFSSEAST